MVDKLKIIQCSPEFWDFILNLRNDSEIKKGFVIQDKIEKRDHYEYMNLNNEKYYICLENDDPVGFVGSVNNDIRFAVIKEKQGKGIGNYMIGFIKTKFPKAQAKVKIENISSLKCFKKNGYKIKYYILESEIEN